MSGETGGRVRHVEAELRESEERFRSLAEATFEGVAISKEGIVLEVNRSFAEMFGYGLSEVIGVAGETFVAPESRGLARNHISSGSEEPYEAVGLRKDGTRFDVEIHGKALAYRGDEARVTAIRDVTRRKRAEAELRRVNRTLEAQVAERTADLERALARLKERERRLRESEERLRITFEEASVGMARVGPDGRWLDVNPKLCEIVGYGREELLGKTFQDITHPEDLEVDLGYINRMLEGEIRSYSIEKRYIRKDRTRIWVNLTVSLVSDDSGDGPVEPGYFISVVEDITARRLSELVPEPLTSREVRVLGLIVRGKTNREISRDLSYSVGTVKLHVQHVLSKLGVPDRAGAAARAIEIGLLPPPRPR